MSFNNYNLSQLKSIVKKYRDYHSIQKYSKMDKPTLVSALEEQFRIENGHLHKINSGGYKLPEVKLSKEGKRIKTIQSKLDDFRNRTNKLYNTLKYMDAFMNKNELNVKDKKHMLRKLKSTAKDYHNYSEQINKLEDDLEKLQEGNNVKPESMKEKRTS